jgi:hypothetical protein
LETPPSGSNAKEASRSIHMVAISLVWQAEEEEEHIVWDFRNLAQG